MTDSSTERNHKMYFEKHSNLSKHNSDIMSPPNTPSDSQSKPLNHHLTAIQQRKIFGFEIYIDTDILNQIPNIQEWFQQIISASKAQYIKFNSDLSIPDLHGHNIQLYDKDMHKKYNSCKLMLHDVYQLFKKIRNQHFAIIIFVPEGMVSLLIGTKGHQINKIMKQSHTTIVVNQPINKMTYRTVKIQGYHSDIAIACKIIYEILQEKSSIAYSIEKQPSQLDYSKAKVKTRLILSNSLTTYLSTKKKTTIKKAEQQTKCSIKFKQDTVDQFYKRDQDVCIMSGKLEDVQAMIVVLINLVNDYYCEDRKSVDYTLKMLIPSNYVTKLIGQKGYMIRDIIQRSGGAQIKILSEKQTERDSRECIIAINGTRENKIDATCLILQQIQCFKNGGPILQSGKSINENLAQQFKNSLPLRNEDTPDNNNSQLTQVKFNEENLMTTVIQNQISNNTIVPISPPLTNIVPHLPPETKTNDYINYQSSFKNLNELKLDRENIKEQKKSGKLSPSHNKYQRQHSRSRDIRDKRESKRQHKHLRRDRSKSQSIQFKHDKDFVQIKIVVPKKLANDRNQLTYIESLCKSEIKNVEQRVEGNNEAIICVRGLIKDNQQCIKLLQKRIARMSVKQV